MESMKSADNNQNQRERAQLDGRYGKIGISAVAAAVNVKDEKTEGQSGTMTLTRFLFDRE